MSDERFTATQLKTVLDEQGRRYEWLAHKLGVTPSYISQIMYRRKTIKRQRAEEISALLGVPLSMLFDLHNRSNSFPIVEGPGNGEVTGSETSGNKRAA